MASKVLKKFEKWLVSLSDKEILLVKILALLFLPGAIPLFIAGAAWKTVSNKVDKFRERAKENLKINQS